MTREAGQPPRIRRVRPQEGGAPRGRGPDACEGNQRPGSAHRQVIAGAVTKLRPRVCGPPSGVAGPTRHYSSELNSQLPRHEPLHHAPQPAVHMTRHAPRQLGAQYGPTMSSPPPAYFDVKYIRLPPFWPSPARPYGFSLIKLGAFRAHSAAPRHLELDVQSLRQAATQVPVHASRHWVRQEPWHRSAHGAIMPSSAPLHVDLDVRYTLLTPLPSHDSDPYFTIWRTWSQPRALWRP